MSYADIKRGVHLRLPHRDSRETGQLSIDRPLENESSRRHNQPLLMLEAVLSYRVLTLN
jgi:hypothetical protein